MRKLVPSERCRSRNGRHRRQLRADHHDGGRHASRRARPRLPAVRSREAVRCARALPSQSPASRQRRRRNPPRPQRSSAPAHTASEAAALYRRGFSQPLRCDAPSARMPNSSRGCAASRAPSASARPRAKQRTCAGSLPALASASSPNTAQSRSVTSITNRSTSAAESSIGGKEAVDRMAADAVTKWAHAALIARLGYEHLSDIPPETLRAWAERNELHAYLPKKEYRA